MDDLKDQADKIEDAISEYEEAIKNAQNVGSDQKYDGDFAWPCPGYYYISSPYGYRNHPISGKYKFHKGKVADWSVVTRVQSTIGKNEWGGAMTYDFGIMDECENVTTTIGVKYFDARNPHLKDRFCFYLSFGFRLCM